jgi:glycosyltransferase involved in cell wall biosynthesis
MLRGAKSEKVVMQDLARNGRVKLCHEEGLVSVVVPAYNQENAIEDTLGSVWKQTYRPIELIVVDDGSTDGTKEVVEQWIARRENPPSFTARLITQENSGAPVARNRGACSSQGEFIQFLDSDDLLSEQKIAHQVEALRAVQDDELVVPFCETIFFDDGTDPKEGKRQQGRIMSSSDDPVQWLTDLLGWDGGGGMVGSHAWLVPRTVARAAGPWREGLTTDQDGEYYSRVALASSRIRKTDGKAYYRIHRTQTSQSSRKSAADFRSLLISIRLKEEQLLKEARPEQKHRVRSAAARHFMQVALQSYPKYPALSAVAERWARARRPEIDVPSPSSWKRALLQHIFGWKGAQIASYLYHG